MRVNVVFELFLFQYLACDAVSGETFPDPETFLTEDFDLTISDCDFPGGNKSFQHFKETQRTRIWNEIQERYSKLVVKISTACETRNDFDSKIPTYIKFRPYLNGMFLINPDNLLYNKLEFLTANNCPERFHVFIFLFPTNDLQNDIPDILLLDKVKIFSFLNSKIFFISLKAYQKGGDLIQACNLYKYCVKCGTELFIVPFFFMGEEKLRLTFVDRRRSKKPAEVYDSSKSCARIPEHLTHGRSVDGYCQPQYNVADALGSVHNLTLILVPMRLADSFPFGFTAGEIKAGGAWSSILMKSPAKLFFHERFKEHLVYCRSTEDIKYKSFVEFWLTPFDKWSWLLILFTFFLGPILICFPSSTTPKLSGFQWISYFFHRSSAIVLKQGVTLHNRKEYWLMLFITTGVILSAGYEGVISSESTLPLSLSKVTDLKELIVDRGYRIIKRYLKAKENRGIVLDEFRPMFRRHGIEDYLNASIYIIPDPFVASHKVLGELNNTDKKLAMQMEDRIFETIQMMIESSYFGHRYCYQLREQVSYPKIRSWIFRNNSAGALTKTMEYLRSYGLLDHWYELESWIIQLGNEITRRNSRNMLATLNQKNSSNMLKVVAVLEGFFRLMIISASLFLLEILHHKYGAKRSKRWTFQIFRRIRSRHEHEAVDILW